MTTGINYLSGFATGPRLRASNSTLVLIFAIFAIFVFVLILIKSKGKFSNSSGARASVTSRDVEKINASIELHNDTLHKWNSVTDKMNMNLDRKKREIILARDAQASSALSNLVREFNVIADDVSNYIMRSSFCIDRKDPTGSLYCTDRIKELIVKALAISNTVEELTVEAFDEPHVHSQRRSTFDLSHIELSFFSGCKSKAEVESRYRSLAKAFHPDNKGGDKTMFEELQRQHETKLKEY